MDPWRQLRFREAIRRRAGIRVVKEIILDVSDVPLVDGDIYHW
jgi:hypothetical protein